MKFIILVLLVCTVAQCQEAISRHQRINEAQKRLSTSYSTSIIHNDDKNKDNQAQSSVNVNFQNGESQQIHLQPHNSNQPQKINFSPPILKQNLFTKQHEPVQHIQPSEFKYPGLKHVPEPDTHLYYQALQKTKAEQQQTLPFIQPSKSNHGAYLSALATKQYLNINPLQHQAQASQSSRAVAHLNPYNHNLHVHKPTSSGNQLYNVGYSINIENPPPKLKYRSPNPPRNAHSYRQQKLLNGDVITGTHKDKVEKPHYNNHNYEQNIHASATNILPSNFITVDHGKRNQIHLNFGEKQPVTKVYSDVRNTHGYTWKNISPNVEISGYHSLRDEAQQAQRFDHAAALGKSQGFDISNVVENGNKPYQHLSSSSESQAFNINKELSEDNITPDIGDATEAGTDNLDQSNIDIKLPSDSQSFNFESLKDKEIDLSNFQGENAYHNILSTGGNIEFDKSLLEGFYKNYNPVFYQPEITLPSPGLPKNVNIKLHSSEAHQIPSYNLKLPPQNHFQTPDSQMMVNQHYAFVQAENLQQPQAQALTQLPSDIKPVQEPQEDSYPQQTSQLVTVQKPVTHKEVKTKYLVAEHKKHISPGVPPLHRQMYGVRPVTYVTDKNYKLKTGLSPPPMIIIRQKY